MYSILCRVERWLMREPHTICVSFLLITMMNTSSHQYLMIKVPFNTLSTEFWLSVLDLAQLLITWNPRRLWWASRPCPAGMTPHPRALRRPNLTPTSKGRRETPKRNSPQSPAVVSWKVRVTALDQTWEKGIYIYPFNITGLFPPLNFSKCTKYLVRECILARLLHAIPYL